MRLFLGHMILTCPNCATRYQANDAAFPPAGRRVRCAKCGHAWHQEAPAAEPEEQSVEETPPPREPEPVSPPVPVRSLYVPPAPEAPAADVIEAPVRKAGRAMDRLAMAGGWLGLAVAVLLIGWPAVSYRQAVATLWPASATLYSALGLPVNVRGLAFTDVSYRRETEDRQPVLAVAGKLVNVSGRELAVPQILVILTGQDGRELYRWNFTPDAATLGAGKSVTFLTRVSSPPAGARHLELKFAESGG